MARVFSQKHSSTSVGNDDIYSVGENVVEQKGQNSKTDCFAGNSRVSIPRSDACALHMIGMRRVRTGWKQLVFASISWLRPSRETPAKHSVLPDCHF